MRDSLSSLASWNLSARAKESVENVLLEQPLVLYCASFYHCRNSITRKQLFQRELESGKENMTANEPRKKKKSKKAQLKVYNREHDSEEEYGFAIKTQARKGRVYKRSESGRLEVSKLVSEKNYLSRGEVQRRVGELEKQAIFNYFYNARNKRKNENVFLVKKGDGGEKKKGLRPSTKTRIEPRNSRARAEHHAKSKMVPKSGLQAALPHAKKKKSFPASVTHTNHFFQKLRAKSREESTLTFRPSATQRGLAKAPTRKGNLRMQLFPRSRTKASPEKV